MLLEMLVFINTYFSSLQNGTRTKNLKLSSCHLKQSKKNFFLCDFSKMNPRDYSTNMTEAFETKVMKPLGILLNMGLFLKTRHF